MVPWVPMVATVTTPSRDFCPIYGQYEFGCIRENVHVKGNVREENSWKILRNISGNFTIGWCSGYQNCANVLAPIEQWGKVRSLMQ